MSDIQYVVQIVLIIAALLQAIVLILNIGDIPTEGKTARAIFNAVTPPFTMLAIIAALLYLIR